MDKSYLDFLAFLFDRVESEEDWRFDVDLIEPELTGEQVVFYVKRMLENYETDLEKYSDWQLARGLEYVFSNTFSDLPFFLRDGPSDIESRIEAIKSLKNIFEKCFDQRCDEELGPYSQGRNELNYICYMLWDVTPLTYCEELACKDRIYEAIAEVMFFSLSLSNIACVESGLHGLGHLELYYDEASTIVRDWIDRNPEADPRLIEYAKNAEVGRVQ
ncbi:MAG: hypothetical protein K6L73_06800 [Cellvibrionaceae bacterium]